MEAAINYYNKDDYIETLTGNRVSRKSVLCGSQNIRLAGKAIIKPGAIIRGDLANVVIGRYSVIGENSVLRPSYKKFKGGLAFFPLNVGDSVFIGDNTIVEAATIGSFVHIGNNCVISKRCVIKDCCKILDGSILPPDTVVPPFTVFGGSPAKYQSELSECYQEVQTQQTVQYYDLMQLLPGSTTNTSSTTTTTTTPVKAN